MLDGVPGGPFDISAYKFAASYPLTGSGASKVTFSEVSVTTTTPAARAVMFRRLATGRATRGVLQMLDQPGGSVIATYTMETLYLLSDTVADDGSSGSRPVETFTFLFTRVTIDAGGVSVCWDFNLNSAC
ncbi:MAG: type VI secretion system tube protein Hcp [Myxococcaceae bacterium]